jgi:hypothetical protein
MTYATMNRNFNPERSPLVGLAAVAAAAVTLGLAVLLPTQLAPTQARAYAPTVASAPAAVPMVTLEAPVQIVRLPSVDVTATRTTKAAASRYNVPAVYKQKG